MKDVAMAEHSLDPSRQEEFESESADGFGNLWDSLVAEDESPIDEDLLSAFAEGRLSDPERRRIRAGIAASPRAIELLDGLCEQIALAPEGRVSRPVPAPVDRKPGTTRLARALPAAVAAALLLCVVGLGAWSTRMHSQLAELTADRDQLEQQRNGLAQERDAAARELEERQSRLVATAKEELLALGGGQPVFMTPTMSPGHVELALAPDTASRGTDELTPEEQEQRAARIASVLSPIERMFSASGSGPDPDDVLDWADVLIAAGRWREARDLMDSADLPETAESLNLRAGVALSEADELMNEVADDVPARILDRRESARSLLSEAVELDPDFDPAWFNLYRVHLDLNDRASATAARETYTRLTGRTPGGE